LFWPIAGIIGRHFVPGKMVGYLGKSILASLSTAQLMCAHSTLGAGSTLVPSLSKLYSYVKLSSRNLVIFRKMPYEVLIGGPIAPHY